MPGVYTWADGSTYSGDWVDGMKQGRGLYLYANGDTYEGGYHRGMKHGYGAASWANGSRYIGHWDSGREHGEGRYMAGDGQCYKGTFNQVWRARCRTRLLAVPCVTESGKMCQAIAAVCHTCCPPRPQCTLWGAFARTTQWRHADSKRITSCVCASASAGVRGWRRRPQLARREHIYVHTLHGRSRVAGHLRPGRETNSRRAT